VLPKINQKNNNNFYFYFERFDEYMVPFYLFFHFFNLKNLAIFRIFWLKILTKLVAKKENTKWVQKLSPSGLRMFCL
jgi:hypothetical protein